MDVRELLAHETALAYQAMAELRPHVVREQDFVRRVNEIQRPQGYRLVAVFAGGDAQAVAVAGFRITDHLAWGRTLYCDDLSTRAAHRCRGHSGALMDWMLDEARRQGCEQFHLDSGVGPERADAHRLYFNKGLRISSYHFVRVLRT
jgi:GNAT superfamily N-acetyltransferase